MLRRILRERRAMDATTLLNENARLKAKNARLLDYDLAHRIRIATLERALADARAQLRAEDRARDRAGRFA